MTSERPDKETSLLSSHSEEDLAALRHDMLRFAMLQLRDDTAAEDAVQEAMAAALSGERRFNHHAQLKTWVFSILKHKIIDTIRDRARHRAFTLSEDGVGDSPYDDLFDEKDYWNEDTRPADWGDPEKSFSHHQFWEIFQICLDYLPENTARVFMMREMLGFETKEICQELNISSANCWVVLHRARMSLRLCLEHRWFLAEDTHADL